MEIILFSSTHVFLLPSLDASNCPGSDCDWTANTTDDHIRAIARTIRSMNADVVNLVEVQVFSCWQSLLSQQKTNLSFPFGFMMQKDCTVLGMLNDEIGTEFRYRYYLKRVSIFLIHRCEQASLEHRLYTDLFSYRERILEQGKMSLYSREWTQ